MGTQRTHYVLPEGLVSEIREIAGPRGSSAFVAEILGAELKKRRLLAIIEKLKREPVMKDKDHPELARLGTAAYVREMRRAKSDRQRRIARKLAEPQ